WRPYFRTILSGSSGPNEVYSSFKGRFNEWAHLVAIYSGGRMAVYVNGEESGTAQNVDMTASNSTLLLGRASYGGAQNDYFKGQLDELAYYDRALTLLEIKDHYQNQSGWFCSSSVRYAGIVQVAPTGCGDGTQDADEACDRGAENGVACVPGYGQSCRYCSADCKNVVDVQPARFCGDGKIDEIAPGIKESCDFAGGNIWVSTQSSATENSLENGGYRVKSCADSSTNIVYYKGARQCLNNCMAFAPDCILCGRDLINGTEVKGSIINVLRPDVGYDAIDSDLFVQDQCGNQRIKLFMGNGVTCLGEEGFNGLLYSIKDISTNPVCSRSDLPNDPSYLLKVFDENTFSHTTQYPLVVTPNPSPWQYDIVLSPKIIALNDIRIVVSWTGSGNEDEFVPGYLIRASDGILPYEETMMNDNITVPSMRPNEEYYNNYTNKQRLGIWHHVASSFSDDTHFIRTFTIESLGLWSSDDPTKTINALQTNIYANVGNQDLSGMSTGTYAFYIRAPEGSIQNTNNNLRVDVYMPDANNSGAYSAPARTFYMKQAKKSDYQQAEFWHVLNLLNNTIEPNVNQRVKLVSETALNGEVTTLENGKIVTGIQGFRIR
ncbi:LamG domain-containing protein, partial [Patescibacteria group bacterium]|nr:LamG domain-containing protein [Patescibacteria group bacterium]